VMQKPMARLIFRNGRSVLRLFITNPWVKVPIDQINQEIDENNDGGDEKDDPLDHWKIPLTNRLEDEPPNPWQMEYILNNNRACEKIPCLKTDDRDHRDDGVPKGMLVNHDPFGKPFTLSGPDIIFSQDFKHRSSRHTGENCRPHQPERDGRKKKGLECLQRSHQPWLKSSCREPMEGHGKEEDEENACPEGGHSQADL